MWICRDGVRAAQPDELRRPPADSVVKAAPVVREGSADAAASACSRSGRSWRSSTRTRTSGSISAERKAARAWLATQARSRGPAAARRAWLRPRRLRDADAGAEARAGGREVLLAATCRSTTPTRCARSSSSSRSRTGSRRWPTSTTPTSTCRRPRPSTARRTRTSASTSAACRRTSWCPRGSKRSLNLSFDFVDDKQALHGYRTLNLLNANGDPTFLRAVLYSEIARAYIPAPQVNFMRVVINGESWGVYVNAQQFNKDFLREYFATEKGARWKVPGQPGRPRRAGVPRRRRRPRTSDIYEIKTKDDPEGVDGSDQPVQGAERDAARQARGGARADPRRRRGAQVPGARRRARQQRRLLDARQRLQHLPGREGPLPRHPARHERGAGGGRLRSARTRPRPGRASA